jgi:hypothetical protein
MSATATAYELAAHADNALRAGNLDKARKLMAKAAELNGGYAIRAAHLGEEDWRRMSVGRTLVRVIVKPLVAAGCTIEPLGKWSSTSYLVRHSPPWHMSLFMGPVKFGKALGVNAARWTDPKELEYFQFADVGLPFGQINYTTQTELEEACLQWRDVLLISVLPWGEGEAAG